MGWRSTLRSIEADRKRRERVEYRKRRLISKVNNTTDKAFASFDQESNRELSKIRDYEVLLSEKPISRCNLHFIPPNRYEFDEFADKKGIITYQFQVTSTNDDVQISPTTVEFEKRVFTILGVCFSQYGTFVAFDIEYKRDVPGAKTTKLINKASLESSLLALKSGEQLFFPVEGNVDGQVIADTKKTSIVVFEPFEDPVDEFEIVFIPKEESDSDVPHLVRVFGQNVRTGIIAANSNPSLFDTFYAELSKTKSKYVSKIDNDRREVETNVKNAASTGCMVIASSTLMAIGFVTYVVVTYLATSML